jgi:hypothetical protein
MALSKGPGDDLLTQSEVLKLHRELQQIENKDGNFTEREKNRIDTINKILDADPDLRKTLVALDARQKKEIQDIVQKQRREPSPAFGQQYADMEKRHDKERDRYITDHQKAQSMREEMRETEKRESLDRGIDPDQPKMTR